jgi:hypothetical protein
MNSIPTPSLPKEKKRFLLPFLLCSLAVTSVALGGPSMISFSWPDTFHPYTNDPGSAILEAEWIVYPNGLPAAGATPNPLDFYLTATTPHMTHGGEILFRYWPGHQEFSYFGYFYSNLDDTDIQDFIGTKTILGQSRSVLKYRFLNERTEGPEKVKLTCRNRGGTIAAASNTASLPQSTIYVTSTYTFASSGIMRLVSSAGGQDISYTGTTTNGSGFTTSFTGCTGGTGTLATGNEVAELSGNQSSATHFHSSVSLYNYKEDSGYEVWFDIEFDPPLIHDCTACGGVCGNWGPLFENNNCSATGILPPIGVFDWRVSVDGGPFVRGNSENAIFTQNPYGCSVNPFYSLMSYNENYQWIIKQPDP